MREKKRIFMLLFCMVFLFTSCFQSGWYTVKAEEQVPAVTMDGASIRTDGAQGLRFKITVQNASKADDYGIDVMLNGKTIRVSKKNGYTLLYSYDAQADTLEYTAVITGMDISYISKEFQAEGFVSYQEDGMEKEVKTNAITRSIGQVAEMAGYVFDQETSKWVLKGQESTTESEETTSEEVTSVEETTEAEETTPVEETTEAEETTPVEETTEAEETTPAEETTEAEETTSVEETTTEQETTTASGSDTDDEFEEVAGYRIPKKMMSEGTSLRENQDGSFTISFTNPYDAVYVAFPEGKTAADYFSVSVDASSSEQFGLALTDKDGNNLKTSYPAYTVTYETRDEYVLSFDSLDNGVTAAASEGCYLRFMTLKNVLNNSPARNSPLTIYSITFRERPKQEDQGTTLLQAYKDIFGYVGNAGDLAQLKNESTLEYYKSEYNSFTSGNEMKPDYILRKNGTKTLVSTSDAKEKYGYEIPEGYKEETVPELYFDVVDETLKIAHENGIKMRGHTLIWHSQTPSWFFKEGYSDDGAYVSPEVMNERIKFYVTNVLEHVHKSEYGDVIYAWDVANEYLNQGTDSNKSGWVGVYQDEIVQNGQLVTTPEYVKIAFQTADSVLRQLGVRDQVHLFYNDYNTYANTQKCCDLIDYLNEQDDALNTEGNKLCDGIGMQSHLDVMWPSAQIYLKAVDAFAKKGYEIQITELDVTLNRLGNENNEQQQIQYWQDVMEGLVAAKKNGANITAFVIWGMYDDISWRKENSPLLFSHSYYEKKDAYDVVIKAAETYSK